MYVYTFKLCLHLFSVDHGYKVIVTNEKYSDLRSRVQLLTSATREVVDY